MSTTQQTTREREVDHRDTLPDLIRHLVEQVTQLIRMEIRLAKVETRQGVKKVALSGVLAWVAMNFAFLFFLFLAVGLTFMFAQLAGLALFWAALITSGICLVVMGLCLGAALWRLKKGEPHLA